MQKMLVLAKWTRKLLKKINGKKNQKANISKPWFDKECIKRREEYYRVKKQLKKVNGSEKM